MRVSLLRSVDRREIAWKVLNSWGLNGFFLVGALVSSASILQFRAVWGPGA